MQTLTHPKKNIGVILGSCVGGAASIDKYYTDEIKGDGGKKEDIFKMGASAIANNVSAHFGLEALPQTSSTLVRQAQ